MESNRRKIGIDIDDVLLDFVGTYVLFHNQTYKTNLKKEDFRTYSFNYARGGTMKQAVNSVKQFYSTSFFKEMKPLSGSVEAINRLKQEYDLYNITSRPDYIFEETVEQIKKHFGNSFLEIYFSSNHYTGRKNSGKSKAEICLQKGISKLIDDSLEYALECAKEGIDALLLDTPWNQNGEHERINRVKNWNEILEKLGIEK